MMGPSHLIWWLLETGHDLLSTVLELEVHVVPGDLHGPVEQTQPPNGHLGKRSKTGIATSFRAVGGHKSSGR